MELYGWIILDLILAAGIARVGYSLLLKGRREQPASMNRPESSEIRSQFSRDLEAILMSSNREAFIKAYGLLAVTIAEKLMIRIDENQTSKEIAAQVKSKNSPELSELFNDLYNKYESIRFGNILPPKEWVATMKAFGAIIDRHHPVILPSKLQTRM